MRMVCCVLLRKWEGEGGGDRWDESSGERRKESIERENENPLVVS